MTLGKRCVRAEEVEAAGLMRRCKLLHEQASKQAREAHGPEDIEPAFTRLARLRPSTLLAGSSILFVIRRAQIVALTARLAIPDIYELSPYVAAGGLMSYGPSIDAAVRPLGLYAGDPLGREAGRPAGAAADDPACSSHGLGRARRQ